VLSFEYDQLNRLRFKKQGASILAEYVYDEVGGGFAGYYGKGRRTTMKFPNGANSHRTYYDARGRVVRSDLALEGTTYTTWTAYDALDRVLSVAYPNGEALTYRYGDHGLPVYLASSSKD